MLADETADIKAQDLVTRCKRGDVAAFRLLYQRYQLRVRATLYQLCGAEMLDDLVQEVFLRVWKGLPKLRQAAYFSTWLYRISWNVATDRRRQFAKQQAEINSSKISDQGKSINDHLFRPQDSPDLMQLHYQDLVQKGLQSLSLDHRAVIVLHDLEDLPQKEIAKILQLPPGTVKSRLHYARKAMKTFLQQEGGLQ